MKVAGGGERFSSLAKHLLSTTMCKKGFLAERAVQQEMLHKKGTVTKWLPKCLGGNEKEVTKTSIYGLMCQCSRALSRK